MFFSGLLGKRSNERDSRRLERNQHSVFDVFDYRFKLQIVRKSYFNLNNFWIEHEDHRNKINFVDIFTSYPVRSKMEKKYNTVHVWEWVPWNNGKKVSTLSKLQIVRNFSGNFQNKNIVLNCSEKNP